MRNSLLSVGLAGAALVAVTNGVGQAQQPPAKNPVLPADRTYTVTLLTGDVVTVHTRQSGYPSVSVRSAEQSGDYHTRPLSHPGGQAARRVHRCPSTSSNRAMTSP